MQNSSDSVKQLKKGEEKLHDLKAQESQERQASTRKFRFPMVNDEHWYLRF